jgi:hypothetical protein
MFHCACSIAGCLAGALCAGSSPAVSVENDTSTDCLLSLTTESTGSSISSRLRRFLQESDHLGGATENDTYSDLIDSESAVNLTGWLKHLGQSWGFFAFPAGTSSEYSWATVRSGTKVQVLVIYAVPEGGQYRVHCVFGSRYVALPQRVPTSSSSGTSSAPPVVGGTRIYKVSEIIRQNNT